MSLADTLIDLQTQIDGALTKINNNIGALQTGKLDKDNNFDNAGTGMAAVTLAAGIKELKALIDNLDATYGTDVDIAAQVAAINEAWQGADADINTLITNIQSNYAALAGANFTGEVTVNGSAVLTTADTIDLGTV